jgi:hypothetical protein
METQQPLEALTLAELFERIARKDIDELTYERAYRVFHARYKDRLGSLCEELAKNKKSLYHNLSLEIFQRTLAEVAEQAGTYRVTKRNSNREEEDALVLGWMGQIAQLMLDAIMEERDTFQEEKQLKADILKADKKKLDAALASLSKRDREILLEYYKPNGIRKYLSKERIDYLCRRWKITEDNLLQIKHRAYKKISGILLGNEKEQDKSRRSTDAGP